MYLKAFENLGFNEKLETFMLVVAQRNAVRRLEEKLQEYVEQKKLSQYYMKRQANQEDEYGRQRNRRV